MGQWLQQILNDIRQRQDYLTTWLRQKIKKAMLVHLETNEGFRYQRLTNRANIASAKSSKYIVEVIGSRGDIGGDVQVHSHAEGE
ncbi:hypothetical protein Ahy_A06g029439 [Arachis hypogaea]|uniref:Uncharacterized protein n=1 Tax=Arachis hypogaea TaxID=3818 RepID=A0A445CTE2_ARAHY|nr:hypothetical protein Ahy_A06g029439 [Arachis hypogaea]